MSKDLSILKDTVLLDANAYKKLIEDNVHMKAALSSIKVFATNSGLGSRKIFMDNILAVLKQLHI